MDFVELLSRKRDKTRRDKFSGIERIEVRYPLSSDMVSAGILPKYQIFAMGPKRRRSLGEIYVSSDRLYANKGRYIVRKSSDGKDSLVGERDSIADADSLAHKTAINIAHRIAKDNGLRLENLATEDQDKLEEDELAREIDKLRKAKIPAFILFTIVGVALSISSLSATGNAISNLTNTTQGLLGIFLFIFGLAGLAFGRK